MAMVHYDCRIYCKVNASTNPKRSSILMWMAGGRKKPENFPDKGAKPKGNVVQRINDWIKGILIS